MYSKPVRWKRSFFTIWAGQAFSQFGSAAAQFALIWWLAEKTGSPAVLALAGIAGFLPQALLGPFAGVWIDRHSRKAVMIASDLFVAAPSAVLAVAFVGGYTPAWLVYLVLFLRSLGETFHVPAMQAAMPMLVPESELVRAGGWSQFLQSGSWMLGPVLGAALMASSSIPAIMVIDVVGALIAAATLAAVHLPDPPATPAAERAVLREMREAVGEIRRHRALLAISVPVLVTTLAYLPVSALYPLFIVDHFGGTAWHASAVEFLYCGGMMATSLAFGATGGTRDKFLPIHLSVLGLGVTLVAAGLLPSGAFVAFGILSALTGAAGNAFLVPYMAYVQATVAPAALGRVLSLVNGAMSFAVPLGLVVAGPVAEAAGMGALFVLSGAVVVATSVAGYLLTRRLDYRPERVPLAPKAEGVFS